jgi:hypothetical protein
MFPDSIFFGLEKCTVSQEAALEDSDKDLQHLKRNTSNFGGVAVLLADDFPQNIRAIPLGTETYQFQACMRSSYMGYGVNFSKAVRGRTSDTPLKCLKPESTEVL